MYLHSMCFPAWVSIPCIGLHHSLVPTFIAFHCMDSIPCMVELFALRAPFPPPCTYIYPDSLHGFQFPVWVSTTPMYLHSLHFTVWVHSLLGDLFALTTLSPPPYTYIPCILCVGPILCMGPQYQYSLCFPEWAPFPVW